MTTDYTDYANPGAEESMDDYVDGGQDHVDEGPLAAVVMAAAQTVEAPSTAVSGTRDAGQVAPPPAPTPTPTPTPLAAATDVGMFSQESERLAISIAMNPKRADVHHKLMSLLGPEDFFLEQHQTIWRIIATLRAVGLTADPTSVIDNASVQDAFVGGTQYVIDAVNDTIAKMATDEAVFAAAARVKGFSMTRRLQKCLTMGITLCATGQDFEQVMAYVEDDLINLQRSSKSSRSGPRQVSYYYDLVMARIEAKLDGKDVLDCVPTGYAELDNMLGGGLPNEAMVILAGRPGMGKSAFATAIEQNISSAGRPTLTFSLEMPGTQVVQRNLSRHSRIPLSQIKSAAIRDNDFGRLTESIEELMKAPCYIDDTPGLSISEIRSRSREFAATHPGGVIFVDYLQIIATNAKDPRLAVTECSSGLLQLARELKCPVVALAQLNRDLEKRANKRPVMADLRESGQIEQDASIILFLYRDEVYNPDTKDPGVTEVIGGKNRDGETRTVKFASTLGTMSYSEIGSFQTEE